MSVPTAASVVLMPVCPAKIYFLCAFQSRLFSFCHPLCGMEPVVFQGGHLVLRESDAVQMAGKRPVHLVQVGIKQPFSIGTNNHLASLSIFLEKMSMPYWSHELCL